MNIVIIVQQEIDFIVTNPEGGRERAQPQRYATRASVCVCERERPGVHTDRH